MIDLSALEGIVANDYERRALETIKRIASRIPPVVEPELCLCSADDCYTHVVAPVGDELVYCEEHKDGPRFSCATPKCPNSGFYVRQTSSVAHPVHRFNGEIGEETDNSYEGGDLSDIRCDDCEQPAVDRTPGVALTWP